MQRSIMVYAIDPGTTKSAFISINENGMVYDAQILDNYDLLTKLHNVYGDLWIEKIVSYGMSVGQEVFETCVWTGRFIERASKHKDFVRTVTRKEVLLHHCNSPRGSDATLRAALIDRYGGKEKAIGNKKLPGPLYGVKADLWSALGIATYGLDRERAKT